MEWEKLEKLKWEDRNYKGRVIAQTYPGRDNDYIIGVITLVNNREVIIKGMRYNNKKIVDDSINSWSCYKRNDGYIGGNIQDGNLYKYTRKFKDFSEFV